MTTVGTPLKRAIFDPTGQPEHYDERYVKVRLKYNTQGKKVEEAYFDAANQPVKNKTGYAKVTYTYDLQGNMTEVAFFDAQDQPTARRGGYAKLLRTYDARNKLIEETNYDPQGHPTRDEDGYVTARFDYDSRGYRTATAYFDENNHPTLHKDGYTKILTNYNDKGQSVERIFVGLDGAYVPYKENGCAKVRRTYNERGQVAQRMCFDPDERLAQTVSGYATHRYTYDGLGRETMWTFFDVHGAPVHTRVVIEKVEPDRTGEQNGLRVGDILVSYDGDDIRDTRTFRELELMKGERQRELRILRQDYELRIQVPPGRLTGLELQDRIPSTLSKPGL
jgi:eukaryotic-like serine/threonine-protein kinase